MKLKNITKSVILGGLVVLPFSPIIIPMAIIGAKKKGINLIPEFDSPIIRGTIKTFKKK